MTRWSLRRPNRFRTPLKNRGKPGTNPLRSRVPKNLLMTNGIRLEPLTEPESNSQITTPTEEPAGAMTFFEHLSELRKRIINSLIAVVIGAFVGVYVSKYVINWI